MKPTQAALATILLLALSGCGPEDPDKQTSEAAPVYTEGSRGAASGNDEPDSYEAPLPLARFTLRTKLHEGWQNIVGMDRYFADASAHLEKDGIRAVDQLAKGDGCFLENFHLLTYDHSAPISAFRVVTGEEYSDGRACLETIDGVDDAEEGWRFIGEFCMSKCSTPSRPSHPFFHVEVHMPVEPQPELSGGTSPAQSHGVVGSEGGYYHQLSVCEQNLEREKELFKRQTGLQVVAASCRAHIQVFPGQHDSDFEVQIEGSGESAVRSHGFLGHWGQRREFEGSRTPEEYSRELEAAASARGIAIARANVTDTFSDMAAVSIRYYSERSTPFRMTEILRYEGVVECESRLSRTYEALNKAENPPLLLYCMGADYPDVASGRLMVVGTDFLPREVTSYWYPNLLACETELPKVVDDYHSNGHIDVFSALCSSEGDRHAGFNAVVFRNP